MKRRMALIVLVILLVGVLSGCSNADQELEKQKKIEEFKEKILANQPTAKDFLNDAEELFSKGKYVDARAVVKRLLLDFPDSDEVSKAKELEEKIKEQLDKETQEKIALIRKQNEEEAAKKKRQETALKNMRKKKDEVEGITWYSDSTSPQYVSSNGFFLYIGAGDGYRPTLRFCIQYAGSDWVFFNKCIFNIDGKKRTIEFSYFEVNRDNSGSKVWEWIDVIPSGEQLLMIEEIISSEKTIIRCEGDSYHKDRTITSTEKKALRNVLDAFDALRSK